MSDPTSEAPSYVPPGATVLTPYICPRDAARAIDWYVDVFGAVETMDRFVDPDGRIGHASLDIDGAELMVSDAHPDYGAVAPEPGNRAATFALNLYVPDVDETVRVAEAAGADVQRRPADEFYGSRLAVFVDPFGVRWMVATHLRTISEEDMAAAAGSYAESGSEPGPLGAQT
jgi:PhnB protein